MDLKEKLVLFLDELPVDKLCHEIENEATTDADRARQLLGTFSNEAKGALDLINGYLSKDKRILEVGAGLCFLSLFLKREGYDVVALEPAMGGFGLFEAVKAVVLRHYSDIELEVLDIPADKLDTNKNGQFDVIFSNNVIEHIPDLQKNFSAMTSVLSSSGIMVHACPNYVVPYEPHFGVPVVRVFSNLSRNIFKIDKRANYDVWESLNFITFFDVQKLAYKNNLNVIFERGVLYKSLLRLDQDEAFYERHSGGIIYKGYSLIKKLRLLILIKYVPPMLSTPMVFSMSIKESKEI